MGLKPTRARTPAGLEHSLGWAGLACVHALTRSACDRAAVLDATYGADVGAPCVAPLPARPSLEEVETPPGRLRIARRAEPCTFPGSLHPDCHRTLDHARRLGAGLGHVLEDWHSGLNWALVRDATWLVVAPAVRVTLAHRAQALGRALHDAEVEPETWRLVEGSQAAMDYRRALPTLHTTGRQFTRAMQGYEAVITPTVPMPPVGLGLLSSSNPAGLTARRQATAFTQRANIAGHPAMSVPLRWNGAGFLMGIQFIGHYGDEATLFRLAGQLEHTRLWCSRRPTLSSHPDGNERSLGYVSALWEQSPGHHSHSFFGQLCLGGRVTSQEL